MKHGALLEVGGGALTLGVSLWLAFGPLRSRLPKFVTRFAKFSVALKLTTVAGVCAWALRSNILHDGSMAVNWGLVAAVLLLLSGAVWVLRRKTVGKVQLGADAPGEQPSRINDLGVQR